MTGVPTAPIRASTAAAIWVPLIAPNSVPVGSVAWASVSWFTPAGTKLPEAKLPSVIQPLLAMLRIFRARVAVSTQSMPAAVSAGGVAPALPLWIAESTPCSMAKAWALVWPVSSR
ncbi:hypothetical protein [Rhodovulum sulfidophilum]|uniref:hypothetical protein n=1 Tax=Rhodovulum sulfidophilum TaxID=35806 RepID=UPI0009527819|nr:hypothetical protein [Rhodovulum sulfidophilum]OLS51875.1 hypothetical protein BV392_07550 [Rhodovulum sulfidophilum]